MAESNGAVLDSMPGHRSGSFEDATARLKLQTLVQNCQQLQREVDAMRRNLGAAKKRKIVVEAEVRFLRRKYQSLVKGSTASTRLSNHSEQIRGLIFCSERRDVCRSSSSPLAHPHCREVPQGRQRSSMLALHSGASKVGVAVKREAWKPSEKTDPEHGKGDANMFDFESLDRSRASKVRTEDLLTIRAPLFDLNEASVGDESFHCDAEPVMSMKAGTGDNFQNGLKVLLCRDAGDGSSSSRVAKRKISWQDPVAVRV